MTPRRFTALALMALLVTAACDDDDSPIAPTLPDIPPEGAVFLDDYAEGVTFQAFADSKFDAVEIDTSNPLRGSAALKVTVPGPDDSSGFFAGGAFTSTTPWNLSGYDVLTFYARSDKNATINVAGLGNDLGASPYMVETTSLDVSGVWRKFIIPIPDPAAVSALGGLFYFAEGQEDGEGYTIWFDDIRFESVGATVVRASMTNGTLTGSVGSTTQVEGLTVTVNAGGPDYTVSATPSYFTFVSSDEAVATVSADGTITIVGEGTATITASVGGVEVSGSVAVSTGKGLTDPAPALPHAAANVVSLFSNQYDNVTVDTWSADWDMADVEDTQVAGDDLKKYTNLTFAGIEFTSATVDASGMTHFHMDIWTPDDVDANQAFKVKLVDFGADGAWSGGDDVEHELTFTASTTPGLARKEWVSLDIPLADFTNLTTRGHVAQLIISGDLNTVYVDNVLFFKDVFNPAEAAPTPTHDAADVISLFSGAYTDVTVDTWSAEWDDADVADVQVAGDDVKLYTNLSFAGIEFTSATIDASSMTHLRFDFWTPDATAAPAAFKVKLVDFGADGAWSGGDDVEHEITLDATSTPPLATGGWVSYDIPLTAFTNLTTTGHLAQLIISGSPNTVFLDNIYLHK